MLSHLDVSSLDTGSGSAMWFFVVHSDCDPKEEPFSWLARLNFRFHSHTFLFTPVLILFQSGPQKYLVWDDVAFRQLEPSPSCSQTVAKKANC